MAVMQGHVHRGGFAYLYLLHFCIERCILLRIRVGVAVGPLPAGRVHFLVLVETVRWSAWILTFLSRPLIPQPNAVKFKAKPQNHFIPCSPKFTSDFPKIILLSFSTDHKI